jgi:excalibur domain protein
MGEKMKAFWQGRKKWQKWTIVIVGIGLLGGFLSLFDPEIPNVLGQDLPAAVKTLNEAGYKNISMQDENGKILYNSADYVVTAQDPGKGKTSTSKTIKLTAKAKVAPTPSPSPTTKSPSPTPTTTSPTPTPTPEPEPTSEAPAPAPEPAQPGRQEEAPAPAVVHQEQRAPAPAPEPEVFYKNCAAARAAGAAPIYRGQPGYRSKLDADGDGIACDK